MVTVGPSHMAQRTEQRNNAGDELRASIVLSSTIEHSRTRGGDELDVDEVRTMISPELHALCTIARMDSDAFHASLILKCNGDEPSTPDDSNVLSKPTLIDNFLRHKNSDCCSDTGRIVANLAQSIYGLHSNLYSLRQDADRHTEESRKQNVELMSIRVRVAEVEVENCGLTLTVEQMIVEIERMKKKLQQAAKEKKILIAHVKSLAKKFEHSDELTQELQVLLHERHLIESSSSSLRGRMGSTDTASTASEFTYSHGTIDETPIDYWERSPSRTVPLETGDTLVEDQSSHRSGLLGVPDCAPLPFLPDTSTNFALSQTLPPEITPMSTVSSTSGDFLHSTEAERLERKTLTLRARGQHPLGFLTAAVVEFDASGRAEAAATETTENSDALPDRLAKPFLGGFRFDSLIGKTAGRTTPCQPPISSSRDVNVVAEPKNPQALLDGELTGNSFARGINFGSLLRQDSRSAMPSKNFSADADVDPTGLVGGDGDARMPSKNERRVEGIASFWKRNDQKL